MADEPTYIGEIVIDRLAHGWKVTTRLRDRDGHMQATGEPFHLPSHFAAVSFAKGLKALPTVSRYSMTIVDNAAGGAK